MQELTMDEIDAVSGGDTWIIIYYRDGTIVVVHIPE